MVDTMTRVGAKKTFQNLFKKTLFYVYFLPKGIDFIGSQFSSIILFGFVVWDYYFYDE